MATRMIAIPRRPSSAEIRSCPEGSDKTVRFGGAYAVGTSDVAAPLGAVVLTYVVDAASRAAPFMSAHPSIGSLSSLNRSALERSALERGRRRAGARQNTVRAEVGPRSVTSR